MVTEIVDETAIEGLNEDLREASNVTGKVKTFESVRNTLVATSSKDIAKANTAAANNPGLMRGKVILRKV